MSYLQEELRHDPWKLLVACCMLNQTSGRQVRTVIWSFFDRWPDAASLSIADQSEVADHIRPLGLHNVRSKRLIALSALVAGDPRWIELAGRAADEEAPGVFPGFGKYSRDSWIMFVENRPLDVEPTDKELIKYQAWYREEYGGEGAVRRDLPGDPVPRVGRRGRKRRRR